jgi:hypothetical protein
VEAVTVEFDRQSMLGPAAIDAAAAGGSVGYGKWEACVA